MKTKDQIIRHWKSYRSAIVLTFFLAVGCAITEGKNDLGLAAFFAALNVMCWFGLIISILWDCGLAVLDIREELLRQGRETGNKSPTPIKITVPPRPRVVINASSDRPPPSVPSADSVPCPHCAAIISLPGPGKYTCPQCAGLIEAN
jgi:hypothetical protein